MLKLATWLFEGDNLGGLTARQKVYETARQSIGRDMGTRAIPDALSCAISVNNIVQLALGRDIGGGASTWLMWRALKKGSYPIPFTWRFVRIREDQLEPGDIVISPSGTGDTSRVSNGHVGIYAGGGQIMSNDSPTGTWLENYSLQAWYTRWKFKGRYPVYFYRIIR